eukprot:gene14159-17310_t
MVPADEAARMGLVNRVVAAGSALAEAKRLAGVIASKSSATIRIGKRAFDIVVGLVAFLVLAIAFVPVALAMTDFSQSINWGWQGPGLAAVTQVLNAIGALTLVYAFRYGKAMVVSPLVNAGAPLLTAVLSMALSGTAPGGAKLAGVALALLAALLLALQPETPSSSSQPLMLDLVRRHKQAANGSLAIGIPSVCSAHPVVIAAT